MNLSLRNLNKKALFLLAVILVSMLEGFNLSIYAEQPNTPSLSLNKQNFDNVEVHWKNIPRHPKTQQLILKSSIEEKIFYGAQDTVPDALDERIIAEALRLKNEGVRVKVLELGAGYGVLSLKLAKLGISVYVNDLHEEFLDAMLQEADEQQHRFIRKLPGSIPVILKNLNEDGQFDIIVCARAFPFLSPKEVSETIKESERLLAPNGRFYAVTVTDAAGFLPPEMKIQCEQNGGMLYIDADKFRGLKNGEEIAPPTNTNFLIMTPDALKKQITGSSTLDILEYGFLHRVFPRAFKAEPTQLPVIGESTIVAQEKTTSLNAYVIAEKRDINDEL